MTRPAAVCFGLIVIFDSADAWARVSVGAAGRSGPIEVPESYQQFVAQMSRRRIDFDDLPAGVRLNRVDMGGLRLDSDSASTRLVTRSGLIAGAEPTSLPLAVLADDTGSTPTSLSLIVEGHVASTGFTLLGLDIDARLTVLGEGGTVLDMCWIPGLGSSDRRWIGITEPGHTIASVRIQPATAGDYGIDDVELGMQAAEPAPVLAWVLVGLWVARRLRKGRASA